jgi:hypothetical protein
MNTSDGQAGRTTRKRRPYGERSPHPGIATPAQYRYDATHLLTSQIDNRGNPAGSST